MKSEFFNDETLRLWHKLSSNKTAGSLHIELELYKKLLAFFQAGDYFYFIFNFKNLAFDLLSPQVESILGYSPSEVTVPFFMDCIHPEDKPWFLAFETMTAEFLSKLPVSKLMKYKVRYDFRVKKKNGDYIRVLHQVAVVEHDENGGIIRTLGVHTNITHLKKDGTPKMSIIGLDGEPSYLDIQVKNNLIENKKILTRREKEILKLLMEGKLSKEISDILYISKQTVDTHRKNMLRRNHINNTGELISKAIKQGWV
ncbi:MAG: LuxR C-terminal-related transcriptional regulator [Mucilaginibacter sp.]